MLISGDIPNSSHTHQQRQGRRQHYDDHPADDPGHVQLVAGQRRGRELFEGAAGPVFDDRAHGAVDRREHDARADDAREQVPDLACAGISRLPGQQEPDYHKEENRKDEGEEHRLPAPGVHEQAEPDVSGETSQYRRHLAHLLGERCAGQVQEHVVERRLFYVDLPAAAGQSLRDRSCQGQVRRAVSL